MCAYRGGFDGRTTFLRFGRNGCGGLIDDESGGFELDAGGSFVVAEDVPEGLVGLVHQGHGSFAAQEIAFGYSQLEGGGGAVDGAAGTDMVEDGLLLRGELGLVHEDFVASNTITGERAGTRCRER